MAEVEAIETHRLEEMTEDRVAQLMHDGLVRPDFGAAAVLLEQVDHVVAVATTRIGRARRRDDPNESPVAARTSDPAPRRAARP